MKIRLLGLAIVAALLVAPTAAHTQATPKIVRIGWLSPRSASAGASNFDALRSGLGYVEGRNLVFEKRWADGIGARLPAPAAELVRLKVDVICVAGTPAAMAARARRPQFRSSSRTSRSRTSLTWSTATRGRVAT
jgi:hypothetical protein